jgi:mono/diheme cytochrome c family protein
VYSSNLTPDKVTGLGDWTADDFWRALHHGIGRDGRRLNPAFPYTEFTRLTRADSDALHAWLRTLPPAIKTNRPHQLKTFFDSSFALAAWRSLFFRPGVWRDDPQQSNEWNRGAYLVRGLAHCGACHGGRNLLGGQWSEALGGGLLPTQAWYAPSLQRTDDASVAEWPVEEIITLLRDGVAPRGRVSGPMAEVVQHGTQHLPEADLRAMAVYLKALPVLPARRSSAKPVMDTARLQRGQALYADHCAACHGKSGEGGRTAQGLWAVPALAGNRLLVQEPATNLVRLVALGGFGVETQGHQRPFSMPGFAFTLSDEQIADIVTFLRSSWGAGAAGLSAYDVSRWRGDAD